MASSERSIGQIAEESPSPREGTLGVSRIVFLVLAAATPLGAVVGAMALGFALGSGAGMPGAYVLSGLVLLCFAAGYAAMSQHVTRGGAFYTYITRGLGRPAGLAAASIAVLAYNAIFCSVLGAAAFFISKVGEEGAGWKSPWQLWAVVLLVVVGALGRREVDFNAKILGTLLSLEVAILIMMDIGILAHRGLAAFSLRCFEPSLVFSGAAGAGLVFAFNCFIGFEATAIFGEEAKDPARTVPRATYASVCIIGVFYALTAWSLVSAYGVDQVHAVAANDPGMFVLNAASTFVGGPAAAAMGILLVTSLFAALLATHTATARYFFVLGREGLLPRALGRTHPRWGSPHTASSVQVGLAAVVVLPFALSGADPLLTLSTSTGGIGTLGIIALQAAAAFSVVAFFRKRGDARWLTTFAAPSVGGVGLSAAMFLIVNNYSVLTGSTSRAINELPWLLVVAGLAGFGYALWLRRARPEVYFGGSTTEGAS